MIGVILTGVATTWAVLVALSAIELIAPAERQQFSRRWFNVVYVPFVIAGLVLAVQPLSEQVTAAAVAVARGGVLRRVLHPDHPIEHVAFAIAFAMAWDFWRYWFHRLQHAVPLLWLTHRFHHSDESVNVTTHARHHLSTFVLAELCYVPFLLLFGPLAPHFVATLLMFRIWGYFVHLNVRLPLGRATRWISGPQWHRIHHSVEERHQQRNFATFFPVIDVIFGTYYEPERDEYPRTGLSGESVASDLREATVQPLLDAFEMAAPVRASARGS